MWTRVPSSSPITTRLSAPGLKIENTLIGSFWSRHSAKAVVMGEDEGTLVHV